MVSSSTTAVSGPEQDFHRLVASHPYDVVRRPLTFQHALVRVGNQDAEFNTDLTQQLTAAR
jgi:hypothetical protein